MTGMCNECGREIVIKPALAVGRFLLTRVNPDAENPYRICRTCVERLPLISVPDWLHVEVLQ